jgi:hypothetical protein
MGEEGICPKPYGLFADDLRNLNLATQMVQVVLDEMKIISGVCYRTSDNKMMAQLILATKLNVDRIWSWQQSSNGLLFWGVVVSAPSLLDK